MEYDKDKAREEFLIRNPKYRPASKDLFRATHQKRRDLREKRGLEMLVLKRQGKTLVEIGNLYGVSRERVRQLLSPFPNYKEYLCKKEPRAVILEHICVKCGRSFEKRAFQQIKVCGKDCPGLLRNWSVKKKRERWNERTKQWYATHKDLPAFKLRIKEYNRRAKIKRNLRKLANEPSL